MNDSDLVISKVAPCAIAYPRFRFDITLVVVELGEVGGILNVFESRRHLLVVFAMSEGDLKWMTCLYRQNIAKAEELLLSQTVIEFENDQA